MCHPAYPTATDLRREADAAVRDSDDLVALRKLRSIVSSALARASRIDEIRHPNRRWSVMDLLDALQGQLADIDATEVMIRRSVVVIEDEG